jgi:hypothetical protein
MPAADPVAAGRDDVPVLAAVAARAFAQDAMFTFVFPDPSGRDRRLDRFFRGAIRYGLLAGSVLTTPDRGGVAIWLPSGHGGMALGGVLRSGMAAFR